MQLTVPEDWTSRTVPELGLVVAGDEGDLATAVPSGPRVVANLSSDELPDPEVVLESAKSEEPSIATTPEAVTVDGRSGVAVETNVTRGGIALVSRQVIVQLPKGAYTFTLEAPADQWDQNKNTLQTILDSARFGSAGEDDAPFFE